MEKRVLRPREVATKQNLQPAKRNKRAISCFERVPKAAEQAFNIAHVTTSTTTSTQTENCLIATNAELTRQLIAVNNLLLQKDQKYIEMLEKSYLLKDKLMDENRLLKKRIHSLEIEPLVQVAVNGKLKSHIEFFGDSNLVFVSSQNLTTTFCIAMWTTSI